MTECISSSGVLIVITWLALADVCSAQPSFETAVKPFVERYCNRCHGPEVQEGGFRLDNLKPDFDSVLTAERWAEMIGRINSGEMPPPDEPQPTSLEIQGIVDWIGAGISEGARARMAKRAPVEFYRLSREEYSHTVRDLLGVHYDASAPGEMSADPEWHGFERIGSQLTLSPSHVEKYVEAARTVLDRAYPEPIPRMKKWRKDALEIDTWNRKKRGLLREAGIEEQVRTLIWPGLSYSYLEPTHSEDELPPGMYRAKLKVSGLRSKTGRPPHVTLYCKQLDHILFEQDVIAAEDAPVELEFETFLTGKVSITMTNEVPGPSNSPYSGRPSHQRVFTRLDDPKSRSPWQRKLTDDEGQPLYPLLILDSIEWKGPFVDETDQKKRDSFSSHAVESSSQLEVLRRFARRAWRRPPTDRELHRYLQIIEREQAAGASPPAAWKVGMLGILASHNFYYLSSGVPASPQAEIDDWQLASRLSYFLWSSTPDEELLDAAETGKLHEPQTLKKQLSRMLNDHKIERFTGSFPRQWLQLGKVGMFPPDPQLYPDYDPWLEKSMVQETVGYFSEVFRRNLSIREFLDSDWTILNPRLAAHYDLPAPSDMGFQLVPLDAAAHRGGILTQAAILSLTSDGTRHRPVHRGIWVSECILGKTPNPPPANVDAIEPNPPSEPRATIRMKLDAHTKHVQCAACHRKIDPFGFALDNYDAVGRWRTTEFVAHGKGDHPPVDASGQMPDGRKYDGPRQFKTLLTEDLDQFGVVLVEKLATYALRRPMTIDDRDRIQQIAAACQQDGYRLRDLIEQFVLSDLFLER
ncbi:DUF1592 domain-containing protein [Planctomicrobium sp. SH664]|uniref:DUF1592 domain-containing protein n=1 Tax=Planctomicrobium sp. SH664 TaxID=3448125 RepID=UPI003F5BE343